MGISRQQFERIQQRLGGSRSRTAALHAAPRLTGRGMSEIILGLDPSLRGTGFGILRTGGASTAVLAQGTIACPRDWERSRCLAQIARTLRDLVQKHQPTVCAVEGLFFAQNLKTAIIMGEARGAAMAVIAEAGLDIYEIATRKVKQAIVGYGAAQKLAVAKMVQRLLNLADLPAPDAADALALALVQAQTNSSFRLSPPKKI